MKTSPRFTLLLTLAIGLWAAPAFAASLVLYDFADNAFTPGTVHAHLSGSGIAGGSGLSLLESTTTDTRGLPPALFSGGNDGVLQVRSATKGDEANAIAQSAYFELTITPEAGYEVAFTNVTFDAGSTGNSQPRLLYLHANAGSGFVSLGNSGALTLNSVTSADISLASLGSVAGPVVFRFYAVYDVAGTPTLGIDDIQFNGTATAVPEAHQWLLSLAGVVILGQRLRRRTRLA